MGVRRFCDCCGQTLNSENFMVLSLHLKNAVRDPVANTKLFPDKSLVFPDQELCDACAQKVLEAYNDLRSIDAERLRRGE